METYKSQSEEEAAPGFFLPQERFEVAYPLAPARRATVSHGRLLPDPGLAVEEARGRARASRGGR